MTLSFIEIEALLAEHRFCPDGGECQITRPEIWNLVDRALELARAADGGAPTGPGKQPRRTPCYNCGGAGTIQGAKGAARITACCLKCDGRGWIQAVA